MKNSHIRPFSSHVRLLLQIARQLDHHQNANGRLLELSELNKKKARHAKLIVRRAITILKHLEEPNNHVEKKDS